MQNLILAIMAIAVAGGAIVAVVAQYIPARASMLRKAGKRHEAIRLLEMAARLPVNDVLRLNTLYLLGVYYFQEGRHADAAAQFKRILAHSINSPMEADIRRRLSDSLAGMGDEFGAAAEASTASSLAQEGDDARSLITRAGLLKRQHRYDEAYDVYVTALTRSSDPETLAEIRVGMCLAAFEAGRSADCLMAAEAAIEGGATGTHLKSAYGMAGVASSNLGQFDKAEEYTLKAYQLARDVGDTTDAARKLSYLGNLQMRVGRVRQAIATIDQSSSEFGPTRMAMIGKSEALQVLGLYDEALRAMLESDKIKEPGTNIVHHQRRQHAVSLLGASRIYVELKRLDEAWSALQEAKTIFAGDDKLSLWCDAGAARILALMGQTTQARETITRIETIMPRFADDRVTMLTCRSALAITAFELADYEASVSQFESYLQCDPDICWRPRGLYYIGESHLRLGDIAKAREAFLSAESINVESVYVDLCRQALIALPMA